MIRIFFAGFLSTLLFHQGFLLILYLLGAIPMAPFSTQPNLLGIPSVLSLAFFGGLWGLPIMYLVRHWNWVNDWVSGAVYGAIGPTAVAMLLVFPLKHLPVTMTIIGAGLLINAIWGLGLVLLTRWLSRHQSTHLSEDNLGP